MMSKVVAMQADMGVDQLREALKQPQVAKMVGTDMQRRRVRGQHPSFIMDSMMAVYLKGAELRIRRTRKGWREVEKLYTEYPPQSTEHILHPEKWLAREAPTSFEWPKFEKIAALREWELLDDDVLGEFQWRSVFKEQGLASKAEATAAGWGGDSYAVFKRKDSNATLLLLRMRSALSAQQSSDALESLRLNTASLSPPHPAAAASLFRREPLLLEDDAPLEFPGPTSSSSELPLAERQAIFSNFGHAKLAGAAPAFGMENVLRGLRRILGVELFDFTPALLVYGEHEARA